MICSFQCIGILYLLSDLPLSILYILCNYKSIFWIFSYWLIYLISVYWFSNWQQCYTHLFLVVFLQMSSKFLNRYHLWLKILLFLFISNINDFYIFFLPNCTIQKCQYNRSGKSRHSCFVLDLMAKIFSFSWLYIMS